jgi:hypothetical protein
MANAKLLQHLTGYCPQTDFRDGIALFVAWFRGSITESETQFAQGALELPRLSNQEWNSGKVNRMESVDAE